MPKSLRMRNYCFTFYPDVTDDRFEEMNNIVTSNIYSYCIFGLEVCPETKKDHFQGYMEFNKKTTISSLKKIFPTTKFLERRGTQNQAIDYCKKEQGEIFEFGEKKEQGVRNDLNDIKELLDTGGSLKDVAENHFGSFLRYKFEKYIDVKKTFVHKPTSDECIGTSIQYREIDIYNEYDVLDEFPYACHIETLYELDRYDGEEVIVIRPCIPDRNIIEKWRRGIPHVIKHGYEIRKIMPRILVICIYVKENKQKCPEVTRGNTESPSLDSMWFEEPTSDSIIYD